MKKFLVALPFTCLYVFGIAQKNAGTGPGYYVFDKNGNACELEKASYIGVFEQLADTAWQWRYYKFDGPVISIETFEDKEMSKPHGYFAYFDATGKIDSAGHTLAGRRHKTWYYYTDSLTVWQMDNYDNGKLIERTDAGTLEKRRAASESALKDNGSEASFRDEKNAWRNYLQRNIKYPDRANTLGITGTVMISFIIDTDGSAGEVRLAQSVELSLDDEAIRLIRGTPKWQPAVRDGNPVKAYRRQPITFH